MENDSAEFRNLIRFSLAGLGLFIAGIIALAAVFFACTFVDNFATNGDGDFRSLLSVPMVIVAALWIIGCAVPAIFFRFAKKRFTYAIGTVSTTLAFSGMAVFVCRIVQLTGGIRGSVYGPFFLSLYSIAIFVPHAKIQKWLFVVVLLICTAIFLFWKFEYTLPPAPSKPKLLDLIAFLIAFTANGVGLLARLLIKYEADKFVADHDEH